MLPPAPTPFMVVCECGCGLRYDAHAWKCLPYVGKMIDDDGEEIELRTCACGSTRTVPVGP